MAKCIRCGGSFLTRFKIKLKDEYICRNCALELGFPKDFYLRSTLYSWDDIKDGRDAYLLKQEKKKIKQEAILNAVNSVKMAHYGEERDLICTEQEREIFEILKELMRTAGFDDSPLGLVRMSDSYVTAKIDSWDVARLKYTNRAKWILFPVVSRSDEKIRIGSPEDVRAFGDQVLKTIEIINQYNDRPVPRL